jgi:hypothetical protein
MSNVERYSPAWGLKSLAFCIPERSSIRDLKVLHQKYKYGNIVVLGLIYNDDGSSIMIFIPLQANLLKWGTAIQG